MNQTRLCETRKTMRDKKNYPEQGNLCRIRNIIYKTGLVKQARLCVLNNVMRNK